MKRMSWVIAGCCLLTTLANATDTVSGVVQTLKGRPIQNAKVSLSDSHHHTIAAKTNQQGQFLFKEVQSGTYFFSAEKKHMLTFDESVVVTKAHNQSVRVKLIPVEFAVFHYLPVKTRYI